MIAEKHEEARQIQVKIIEAWKLHVAGQEPVSGTQVLEMKKHAEELEKENANLRIDVENA